MNLNDAKLMVSTLSANDIHLLKTHLEQIYSEKYDEEKHVNTVRGVMEYVLQQYQLPYENRMIVNGRGFNGTLELSATHPSYEMLRKDTSHVMRALHKICAALECRVDSVTPRYSNMFGASDRIIGLNFSVMLDRPFFMTGQEVTEVRERIPDMVAEIRLAMEADAAAEKAVVFAA